MVKTIYIVLLFFVALIISSCERIETGSEVTVNLGQKYQVSWDLAFTIDSINEYRCPLDAYCVWAGDVDLFFCFGNDINTTEMINLNNGDTNPRTINNYTFEVLDVLPYPRSDIIIRPEDIRVKLLITKD